MIKILSYSLLFITMLAAAQEKDKYFSKGNKQFNNEEYADAEANYRISRSKSPAKAAASYNLGNAIYRQKKTEEAKYAYARALEQAKTKEEKHRIYHNVGNILMDEKDYEGAVQAYKNALRNNPYDDETRYNYALAKKMLKDNPPPPKPKPSGKQKQDNQATEDKQQQPKNDNKQEQQDNKPENQPDKADENKGGEGDNNEKKDKKQNEGQGGGGRQQAPAGVSPSKQRMENLLDAMDNEEKKVQDKVNSAKAKSQPAKQEKDW